MAVVAHWDPRTRPGVQPNWSSAPCGTILERLAIVEAHLSVLGDLLRDHSRSEEYLSIERAAKLTSLSATHLRRAIRSGGLPASNVGTASHPTWRIARKDLDAWMQRNKGGLPSIPPKPELKDLIRRHLPGL
jgi:excisionase family DNA binding protein